MRPFDSREPSAERRSVHHGQQKPQNFTDAGSDDERTRDTRVEAYLQKGLTDFKTLWDATENPAPCNTTISDFRVYKLLGEGTYGKVMLVYHNANKQYYALKMIDKEMVVKRKQVPHTLNEKRILQCINFPFVVNLDFSFQNNSMLFLIMPIVSGGELFNHLQKMKKFSEIISRFYSAQVAMALEYLHYLGVVYRDLKPENLLLDCHGYVKVTDFGFAKVVNGRTYTFCGTPEYIAPEIIKNTGYSFAADWWSFGILIYELNAGYAPFRHDEPIRLYELIVDGKYNCPSGFSAELKAAIITLLQVDTSKRYGNLKNGARDIKNLKWFGPLNWLQVYEQKLPAPYTPACKSPEEIAKSSSGKTPEIPNGHTNKYPKEFEFF